MRLLILSLCFAAVPLFAGFRVYKLKVDHFDSHGKKLRSENVMSQLDHLQYENWTGGYGNAKVTYIDSWYCPGDTSHRKYCDKPKEKDVVRGPAAYNRDKRVPVNLQPVIP